MGTEAVAMALDAGWLQNQAPWRRSSNPVRRPANTDMTSSSPTTAHHGEAEADRSSSAEASLSYAARCFPARPRERGCDRRGPRS